MFAREGHFGGGLALPVGDVTTQQVVRGEDLVDLSESSGAVTTPVSASAFDRPPSVFGPMDVDTSDETRPRIIGDDFAKPVRVQGEGLMGPPDGAYPVAGMHGSVNPGAWAQGPAGVPPGTGPSSGSSGSGLQPAVQRAESPASFPTQHLPEYREPEEERGTVTAVVIFVFVALAAFGCTAIVWIVYHKLF